MAPDTPCGSSSHQGMMFRFHALTMASTRWSSRSPSTTRTIPFLPCQRSLPYIRPTNTGTRLHRALPLRAMTTTKVAAVFGVGPGLGASVARRFAREGYAVALLARGEAHLREVHADISREGGRAAVFPADAGDVGSVS